MKNASYCDLWAAFGPLKAKALLLTVLFTTIVRSSRADTTYTSPGTPSFFSTAAVWDLGAGSFGAWSLPASDAGLVLNVRTVGSAAQTLNNDLNLTLNTLNLVTNNSSGTTMATSLGGTYAFTGAAKLHLLGTGTATAFSAPLVLGSGATGLTFDGAGTSGLSISSVISSNTATGAPLTIATDARNTSTGVVALSGNNSFKGGVVLNSGTLSLTSGRALGDITNTLTVNGGTLRTNAVTTVSNNITLNAPLNANPVSTLALGGVISSTGSGLNVRPGLSSSGLVLTGGNTYTGATMVGGSNFAQAAVDGAGSLALSGAVGSLASTAGITVRDGAQLNLTYSSGASSVNGRVSPSNAITTQSGFIQTVGHTGIVTQSLGTVTAGGLTTLAALTNNGGSTANGAGTQVTVGNLLRSTGATLMFQGPNLGVAAVAAGTNPGQGNVILTQIGGAAPSSVLVGGGGASGTPSMSIIPWALGDTANSMARYGNGTGFVTYDTNGVRLLNETTEYYTNNFLPDVAATSTLNVRFTGPVTSHTTPQTVNSLFFAATGQTLAGGANALTITSGALASNATAATISNAVLFGPGGTGEAVISVTGALNTTNTLTLSGGFTAASLTKSGHGDLVISTTNATLTGPITINGGEIRVAAPALLGTPSSITVNGSSQAAGRAGLVFTGSTAEALSTPITVNAGTVGISLTGSGSLVLNSVISGAGGVSYSPAGFAEISVRGANTYTGPTFISGNGLVLFDGNDARFGSSTDPNASFVNLVGGTLQLTGNWTSARAIHISNNSGVLDTQGNNASLSGPITGPVGWNKIGSGTLELTTGSTNTGLDSSYSGNLSLGNATMQGGTLKLSGNGALNAATVTLGASGGPAGTYVVDLSAAADIDSTDGSTTPWRSFNALNTATGFTQAHSVQLGSTAGSPVDLRVNSGTFGSATGGTITGFGKLVKTSTLTLTLGAANTFTGGVEVWGGTLAVSADNQLGDAANGITLAGGILSFTNTLAGVSSARNITLAATPQPIIYGTAVTTLNNGMAAAAGGVTLSGVISGAGGLNKSGSGILTLSGINTYTGGTQISAGRLVFSDNNQLGGAGSRLLLSGGNLNYNAASGAQTVNRPVIVTASNSSIIVTNNLSSLELAGPIVGSSTLTLDSASPLTLSGDSRAYFGTLSVFRGTVNLTGQARRAGISLANVNTALDLGGLSRELGSLDTTSVATTVALGNNGRLTFGFNNASTSFAGNITATSGGSVTVVGTSQFGFQSAASTFSGGFHLLSGSTTVMALNGTLPLQSALTIGGWGGEINQGGLLSLSNTGINLGTRLADTQVIHSNAGAISLATNATTASSETIGSLRGAGQTTVMFESGSSHGGTLNFSDASTGLMRLNRGTFLFRAGNANLGTAAASTSIANLTFGNSGSLGLLGGGGSTGTTTISILPYAAGGINASDSGSNFVTYGTNGIRVLNTSTEVQSSLTAAGATENVRTANASLTTISLSSDLTVNALNMGGSLSMTRIQSTGTEKLTLNSGLLMSTASNVWTTENAAPYSRQLGLHVAELQTGASNSRELNVWTSSDLLLGSKITTSGGLTKSGVAALYLTNSTNSYTGPTTVNAGNLVIDSLSALGGSSTLQMGGGFLKYRGPSATLTQSVTAAGGEAGNPNGGNAGFHLVGGTTLTVGGTNQISGFGGLQKEGTGTLVVSAAQSYSGPTIISGGTLAITTAAALGTNNRVIFSHGGIFSGGQVLRFDANNLTLSQDFITNTAVTGVGFGFDTNGNNATLTGTLLGAVANGRGLYKFGAGNLTLTASQMYTGATQVFGGTLTLSGADGSISSSAGNGGFNSSTTTYIAPGAALVLDNAAANNNNRLPDVWDTPFGTGNGISGKLLMNGGEFKIIGHSGGTQERINQFDIRTGVITLDASAGGNVQLISGRFNRTATLSAGLIRGTNLGATSGTRANWFLTDLGSGSVQLGGAGGAEGTPFVNILPGFAGDTSATGSGTDLITYAADTGIRLLAAGEYTNAIPAGVFDLSRAPVVALTSSDTTAVNETTAITALKMGPGATLNGSGTLYMGQSTILATGSATIHVPVLSTQVTGSNAGLLFLTAGSGTTLTVNSTLPNGSFFKHGEGILLLNQPSLAGSNVTVAQGTLRLGAGGSLAPIGAPLTVVPGATFDLNGADRIISSLATTLTIGNTNLRQSSDGTVSLGGNRLTLYDSSTTLFTGSITGSGGLTKAVNSSGNSVFTQPLAYTGSTLIRGGVLQLNGAATLATSAIELRGGGLSLNDTDDNATSGYTAGRISPSAPLTFAGGAFSYTGNAHTPGNVSLGTTTLEGNANFSLSAGFLAPVSLTLANLERGVTHRGTLAITASNLGLAANPIGNSRIFFTQINGTAPASALIGSGGAIGSTSQSILPWAWSSTAGSFLTYGADGLRPLNTASEYASTLGTAATDNVRTTAATLTAATTANSLIVTTGNLSGAFDLTLTSGALATTASITTIGVNTNTLLTGAGNTRELVINTDSSTTTLNYNLTTSGGVTKFGSSILTLGGTANTFSGGLTINQGSVEFTSDAQLGAAGGGIRFGAPTSGFQRSLSYIGSTPLAFSRPVETTSIGGFNGPANVLWQLNGVISGPGGIAYYSNSSTLYDLKAVNTYTGPTYLVGGSVVIRGDSAFGSGGEIFASISTSEGIVMRGDWTTSRLIHIGSNVLVQTGAHTATWNGIYTGVGGFTKAGQGSLVLTQPSSSTGTQTVNAGTLVLRQNGALSLSSVTLNPNGSLVLDDTGGRFPDRLTDTGALNLTGGNLTLLGSPSGISEEVIGTLAFTGPSTVTLTPGSGQAAILRLSGGYTTTLSTSVLFRGENLGMNAPGTANSANVILTDAARQTVAAYPMTGGGAPAGHPSISIIKGSFGDTSSTGLGTQLVTYDLDKGVRLLNPATEYTTTLVDGSIVTDNVKIQSATITNTAATTANTLWFNGNATLAGTGATTLISGTVLVTGSGNSVTGILNPNGNALVIGGPGDLTISGGNDRITGTGGLTKMGAGTLTVNAKNSYTGSTFLHSGTIALGDASALGNGGSTLRVYNGEIRNTSGSPMTLANPIQLDGTMRIGGSQDLTFSNTVTLNNATREVNVTNTGVTTFAGNVTSSLTERDYGLTKTGAGVLVLSRGAGNDYSGPTILSGGELRLTNTSGSATGTGAITVSNGGILSGTGRAATGPGLGIQIDGNLSIGSATGTQGTLTLVTDSLLGTSPGISIGSTGKMTFGLFSGAGAGDNTANLTASDLLILTTASININAAAQLILENPNNLSAWAIGDKWQLWQIGGSPTITGGIAYTNIIAPWFVYSDRAFDFNANTGVLSIVAGIPEPSKAVLMMLGLCAALFRRRR